jgi:RNA polymerase sigma factor (sigma-70 family)
MGADAIPPRAGGLPTRLVLGPALRAQSDRRLVRLVREGYEGAFEEIVRRYRRPLGRFAASIVGGRHEDVTQDSFRKALEALRRGDAEVELRPWLYRIVRNTALNELRDRPPAAAELAEDLVGGGRSVAVEVEERETVAALTARLRGLPEKQRAALVMRELEGMSHEEIAAALGISGGAARQAIARGRAAVRSGFGALVPLPLLRALASGAGEGGGTGAALGEAAGGGGVAASGALGGASAIGGGAIGAGALKVGLATVLVAGSVGAGVAVEHHGDPGHRPDAKRASISAPGGSGTEGDRPITSSAGADLDRGRGSGSGAPSVDRERGATGEGVRKDVADEHRRTGRGEDGADHARRGDDDHGNRDHRGAGEEGDDAGGPQAGLTTPPTTAAPHRSDGDRGPGGTDGSHVETGGRSEGSGSRGGGDDSGSSTDNGGGGGHDDADSSHGGNPNSGRGGHGSDEAPATIVGAAPIVEPSDSSSGGPGPSSGSSGSGSSGGGDASPALVTPPSSGSGGGPSTPVIEPTVTDEDSHSGGGPGSPEESEVLP